MTTSTARPKAADIADEDFLAALLKAQLAYQAAIFDGTYGHWPEDSRRYYREHLPSVCWWHVNGHLPERIILLPEKVLYAKARRLIRRGLLDGCACGCRGDFEITDAGKLLVEAQ